MAAGDAMGDEGAFVRAFRSEMSAAAHDALVETFVWVSQGGYAFDPDLRARGEAWAKRVEAAGRTWDVLLALARD